MTSFECFRIWLIGLLPSLIFGFGGTILWTCIMFGVDRYNQHLYPDRNGSRARKESIEANKHLTIDELNLIDRNPGYYKTCHGDQLVFKDALDGNHLKMRRNFDFRYYRCNHCGHVMKVLIWKEYPQTPLPIETHWCRGCQQERDVTEIDAETYNKENSYYLLLLRFMEYTKIDDIGELNKILYGYLKRQNNYDCGRYTDKYGISKTCKLSKEFEIKYGVKSGYVKYMKSKEPYCGVKYIWYNDSKIGEDKYSSCPEPPNELFDNVIGTKEYNLTDAIIMFDKFRNYDFYKRIFIPRKMPVADYIRDCGKEEFLRFIDDDGLYKPPREVDWDKPGTIELYRIYEKTENEE